MHVSIDANVCSGHGRCWSLAPEVFGCDDVGNGVALADEVPAALADQARTAVRNCPEGAITLVE